ncbi:hypothetical protein L1987_32810 [Smallanthus sonchifolius]|uniref:Uncharacterized protein n=1 Tax=Smallanthus sonchifolius TaxID=185202 RepID=A0ACB9HPL0_9ASTR|nr:hypothetical protein L1987_32810 [Smallanthus sonchifolius]
MPQVLLDIPNEGVTDLIVPFLGTSDMVIEILTRQYYTGKSQLTLNRQPLKRYGHSSFGASISSGLVAVTI